MLHAISPFCFMSFISSIEEFDGQHEIPECSSAKLNAMDTP